MRKKKIISILILLVFIVFAIQMVFSITVPPRPPLSSLCETNVVWSADYQQGIACPVAPSACPSWFSSTMDSKVTGTTQVGNNTVNLMQCRYVCLREGKCLDKDGFDDTGFNPTSGALREGGTVPDYYSGSLSCSSYPCNIVIKGEEMNIESLGSMTVGENGVITAFKGSVGGDGSTIAGLSVSGTVDYSLAGNIIILTNARILGVFVPMAGLIIVGTNVVFPEAYDGVLNAGKVVVSATGDFITGAGAIINNIAVSAGTALGDAWGVTGDYKLVALAGPQGLVVYAFIDNYGNIVDGAGNTVQWTIDASGRTVSYITDATGNTVKIFKNAAGDITNVAGDVIDFGQDISGDACNVAENAGVDLCNDAENIAGNIYNGAGGVSQWGIDAGGSFLDATGDSVEWVTDDYSGDSIVVGVSLTLIGGPLVGLGGTRVYNLIKDEYGNIEDEAGNAFQWTIDEGGNAVGYITDGAGNVWGTAEDLGGDVGSAAENAYDWATGWAFLWLPLTGRAVDGSDGNNAIINITTVAVMTKPYLPQIFSAYTPINSSSGNYYYYYINNSLIRVSQNPESGKYLVGRYSSFNFEEGNTYVGIDSDDNFGLGVRAGAVFIENRSNQVPLVELVNSGFIGSNAYLLYTTNVGVGLRANALFNKTYSDTVPLELNSYILVDNNSQPFLNSLLTDSEGNNGKIIINNNREMYILNESVSVDANGNMPSQGNIDNIWVGVVDKR